eukprot:1323843-Rhodomonas_salina.3
MHSNDLPRRGRLRKKERDRETETKRATTASFLDQICAQRLGCSGRCEPEGEGRVERGEIEQAERLVLRRKRRRSSERGGTRGSKGKMTRKDPRSDAEQYLEKHNIRGLFKHLSTKLLFAKPEDPKAFLVEELKKVYECQQGQTPVLNHFFLGPSGWQLLTGSNTGRCRPCLKRKT